MYNIYKFEKEILDNDTKTNRTKLYAMTDKRREKNAEMVEMHDARVEAFLDDIAQTPIKINDDITDLAWKKIGSFRPPVEYERMLGQPNLRFNSYKTEKQRIFEYLRNRPTTNKEAYGKKIEDFRPRDRAREIQTDLHFKNRATTPRGKSQDTKAGGRPTTTIDYKTREGASEMTMSREIYRPQRFNVGTLRLHSIDDNSSVLETEHVTKVVNVVTPYYAWDKSNKLANFSAGKPRSSTTARANMTTLDARQGTGNFSTLNKAETPTTAFNTISTWEADPHKACYFKGVTKLSLGIRRRDTSVKTKDERYEARINEAELNEQFVDEDVLKNTRMSKTTRSKRSDPVKDDGSVKSKGLSLYTFNERDKLQKIWKGETPEEKLRAERQEKAFNALLECNVYRHKKELNRHVTSTNDQLSYLNLSIA